MKLDYPKATSIDNAIPCGQWGKNNVPIYHLQSATALNQLVGYVKFKNGSNGTVLYRGQGKDYNTLSPSGCRESSIAVSDAIISAASSDDSMVNFFQLSDPEISGWEKYKSVIIESALQHYGASTYCMDFVDNHWCALWFGLYKFENGTYDKRTDNDGFLYLYMYLADTNGSCIRGMYIGEDTYTVDLRKALPSCFLRPAAQHGWIVRKKERTTCTYDDNVVCVAKIQVSDAAKWLGEGELLSQDNFFPNYDIDQGYRVLLQRQKRSGVLCKNKKEQILPSGTVANYHRYKGVIPANPDAVAVITPIRDICKGKEAITNILDLYRELLHFGWSKETCINSLQSRWSERNPCIGQSGITALLIQNCFGGEIYYFRTSNWNHYFNKISGEIIDLTCHEVDSNCVSRYETASRVGESEQAQKRFYKSNEVAYKQLLKNCKIRIKRKV